MKKSKMNMILQIGFVLVMVILIILYIVCATFGRTSERVEYSKAVMSGEIVCDNGDSFEYSSENEFENKGYKSIHFKGQFTSSINDEEYLIVHMNNLWVDIRANGKPIATNVRTVSTDTPGNSIAYVKTADIPQNCQIEITLTNPYYDVDSNVYINFFDSMIAGPQNSLFEELIYLKSGEILVGILIALLGIMTFSLAGLLIRDLRFQNITFSLVAFVGGMYLFTDSIYNYLPLFIKNPLICFLLDEASVYLLVIVFLMYILSNLKDKIERRIVSCSVLGAMLITLTAFLLQIFGVQDIMKSEFIIYIFCIPVIIMGVVILIKESKREKSASARLVLGSFLPIFLAVIISLVNYCLDFAPNRMIMRAGILVTIIIQLINLVIAVKKSNEESLNYEKMQSEILKSRVLIMISQIQPHFLYNSLTSIAQLCEKNPKQAKTATIDFANYLRGNMNSLKDESVVPFERELSHLKTYLSLEKMRFGEELNIVYDIQTEDFCIPSLTVQPLVENAVKHGVGMKEDGGTVTIATREYDDRYEVTVTDDGVGFDTSMPSSDTLRTHIGIDNIKARITSMCNGEVVIESEVGKGTVSTIKIYKEEN